MKPAFVIATLPLLACAVAVGMLGSGDQGTLPGVGAWSRDDLPFTIIVDENASPEVLRSLEGAVEFWRGETNMRLFEDIGELSENGRIISVMYYFMSSDYYAASTGSHVEEALCPGGCHSAAFVRFWKNRENAVVGASVHLNGEVLDRLEDGVRQRVIAHELGHLLTLAHDDDVRSVMYAKAARGPSTVTAHDRSIIAELYGRPHVPEKGEADCMVLYAELSRGVSQ